MKLKMLACGVVAAASLAVATVSSPVTTLAADVPVVLADATTTTDVSSLSESVTTITDIAGNLLGLITANPILMVFFAAPLIGIAVGVIRKFKRA